MKTATLKIEEKVKYMRHVRVQIPDDMDDEALVAALWQADAKSPRCVEDYLDFLRDFAITCAGPADDDMSYPDDASIQCYDFDVEPHTEQAPTGEDQ